MTLHSCLRLEAQLGPWEVALQGHRFVPLAQDILKVSKNAFAFCIKYLNRTWSVTAICQSALDLGGFISALTQAS